MSGFYVGSLRHICAKNGTTLAAMASGFDLKRVSFTVLNGERERGSSGVVWSKLDSLVYTLLSEIEDDIIRENLVDILNECGNEYVILCIEEQDNTVHVTKVLRTDVYDTVFAKSAPSIPLA